MDLTEHKKDTANFVWSDNFRRTTNIQCPECGALLICDESRVLTSNPPMHWYYCPDCREFQMNANSDTNLQAYILKKFGKVSTCASSQQEDPVDIHDELSKGFARIENVIREESAKMAEIIREAVVQKDYVYKPTAPTIYWPNTYIPEACRSCTNHPSNGGTGICHCTLGLPSVTCNSIDCQGK